MKRPLSLSFALFSLLLGALACSEDDGSTQQACWAHTECPSGVCAITAEGQAGTCTAVSESAECAADGQCNAACSSDPDCAANPNLACDPAQYYAEHMTGEDASHYSPRDETCLANIENAGVNNGTFTANAFFDHSDPATMEAVFVNGELTSFGGVACQAEAPGQVELGGCSWDTVCGCCHFGVSVTSLATSYRVHIDNNPGYSLSDCTSGTCISDCPDGAWEFETPRTSTGTSTGTATGSSGSTCSDCLASCSGMASCCEGSGCICESACDVTGVSYCSDPDEVRCCNGGFCVCMSSCPY